MPSILEAKKLLESEFLNPIYPVSGIGINHLELGLTVYLTPSEGICQTVEIPNEVYGYPVNTVCLNRPVPFHPQDTTPTDFSGAYDPCSAGPNTGAQYRYRPLCGGISAAHYRVGAGTLGLIMKDIYTNRPVLLSNNHVFANMSSNVQQRALKGDAILQPSVADGGTLADKVATLERWIPYDVFGPNLVDAAIATPLPGMVSDDWESMILASGTGQGFTIPEKLVSVTSPITVRKYGRTGGVTTGTVLDWDFSTTMPYPIGISVKYVDQLLIHIDTCAGDSGSVYLDNNDNIIGLHAGGTEIDGERYAVANKIKNVTALLGLSLH